MSEKTQHNFVPHENLAADGIMLRGTGTPVKTIIGVGNCKYPHNPECLSDHDWYVRCMMESTSGNYILDFHPGQLVYDGDTGKENMGSLMEVVNAHLHQFGERKENGGVWEAHTI